MLITRDQKSKVEQYFIYFPKLAESTKFENKKYYYSDYDAEMFEIIENIIRYYERDTEKSAFISKCIIGQKSWKIAYHELHIERRTYFAWKDEILSDAVICAVINGLMVLDLNMVF